MTQPPTTDPIAANTQYTRGVCASCDRVQRYGRSGNGPIHCIRCHLTWSGTEAQHCPTCHHTFASIFAADHHRTRNGDCTDPAITAGWHEKRPNVWTYGTRPDIAYDEDTR